MFCVLTRCTTQLLTYPVWQTLIKRTARRHINPFSKEFQILWMRLLKRLLTLFSPGVAFCRSRIIYLQTATSCSSKLLWSYLIKSRKQEVSLFLSSRIPSAYDTNTQERKGISFLGVFHLVTEYFIFIPRSYSTLRTDPPYTYVRGIWKGLDYFGFANNYRSTQ